MRILTSSMLCYLITHPGVASAADINEYPVMSVIFSNTYIKTSSLQPTDCNATM